VKITPQEFILKHAAQPYDAAKRREYYLRTRELKGRKAGGGRPPPTGALKTAVKTTAKKVSTSNREEIQRRREEVANRVAALNIKLDRLRGILSDLDKQAGGNKSEDKTKEKKKELTPAEKKKAAKEAKERREKSGETKESPAQAVVSIQKKIEAIQEQIREKRLVIQKRAARKSGSENSRKE
jgi:hypothetical protein